MNALAQYVLDYGLPLIFVIVLLAQLGIPIPALPLLIVAGALTVDHDLSVTRVLAVSVVASLVADLIWYGLGRSQGYRILKTLCRISLSPDSCVRQTESLFRRWGVPSLLVAKFIPGFSTVAPPLAGALGIGTASFVLWDAGGALLWSGAAVVSGMIFHRAIDRVVGALTDAGGWALVVLGAALALFIAVKWWERRRFYQFLRMARISVDEVWKLIEDGKDPIILDVRTAEGRAVNPRRIKGAAVLELDNFDRALEKLPRDREIILYCT